MSDATYDADSREHPGGGRSMTALAQLRVARESRTVARSRLRAEPPRWSKAGGAVHPLPPLPPRPSARGRVRAGSGRRREGRARRAARAPRSGGRRGLGGSSPQTLTLALRGPSPSSVKDGRGAGPGLASGEARRDEKWLKRSGAPACAMRGRSIRSPLSKLFPQQPSLRHLGQCHSTAPVPRTSLSD